MEKLEKTGVLLIVTILVTSVFALGISNVTQVSASPAPGAFDLISPDNGIVYYQDNTPTLQWGASSGVDHYEVWVNVTNYEKYYEAPIGSIDDTNTPTGVNLLDIYTNVDNVSAGTTHYETDPLPDRWTYKWYVVAVDSVGGKTQSNSTRTFSLYHMPTYALDTPVVDGCHDSNANGTIQPYENWKLPVEDRVDDLMGRMSKYDKAWQMVWYAGGESDDATWGIHKLEGPGGYDTIAGYDQGGTIFPMQPGLAAITDNQDIIRLCADVHRREALYQGDRQTLSFHAELTTSLSYDRIHCMCGENASRAYEQDRALALGYNDGPEPTPRSVVTFCKHYLQGGCEEEQSMTEYTPDTIKYHLMSWAGGISAGLTGCMPGYSEPPEWLTEGSSGPDWYSNPEPFELLYENMGFKGITVTDWVGDVQSAQVGCDIQGGASESLVSSIESQVSDARVNESARRILTMKFKLGLFEWAGADHPDGRWTCAEHDEIVDEAARQTMTLLKNDGILPLSLGPGDTVLVRGDRADDKTCLSSWNSSSGVDKSILDGIQDRAAIDGFTVLTSGTTADVAIVIEGEARFQHNAPWGNSLTPPTTTTQSILDAGTPVVSVFILARPYVLTWFEQNSNAIIAAYRPGDGGDKAVIELILGDYDPSGKLPWQLPKTQAQADGEDPVLPYDLGATPAERTEIETKMGAMELPLPANYGDPLFHYGFGLSYVPDTTPPVISNVASTDITASSAKITWDTDEFSDSVVNYGKTTALGSSESDDTMVTAHSITLTNLSASTTYYYEVQSTDASSNTATDDNNGSYYTFTTAPPDTTPPVIENVASSSITTNSVTITWDTDELSDSLVKYGTSSGSYTANEYDSTLVKSHSLGLTGLMDNTTYYYVVNSTDSSSNTAQSSEHSFTTEWTGQTPYGGIPWAIPGRIEAEDYDIGGENVAYHDSDAGNTGGAYRSDDVDIQSCSDTGGGYNVGWIATGEWLEYTVDMPISATFDIKVRVASIHSGKSFHIEFNGEDVTGPINVPNTGGWQNWTTVTVSGVDLSWSYEIMRIAMDSDLFNINYVDIVYAGDNTPPAAPTGLTATAVSSSQIDLDWANNTETDLDHYSVYKSTTSGFTCDSSTFVDNTTENAYSDAGLTENTTYYYKVTAVDTSGNESDPSNEASATTETGPPTGDGLTGEYFNNKTLTGPSVLTRVDATVNFDWGNGSPDPSVNSDDFSVRWTGQVKPLYSETHTFYTTSDDGVRLWVNGQQLINNWTDHAPTEDSGTISLTAGNKYNIKMEYYERGGGAVAQLRWSSASQTKQIIPQSQLYSAAGQGNLALNQPVTVSSVEKSGVEGPKAVDGNTGTRWSSAFSDPQWIYVDLGSTYNIEQVVLNWETAYGKSYQIQVSDDASSWTDIYSTTTGDGGIDDLTGLSGSGRYVRMYGTERGTQWGYSLWEFEVYGS